MIVYIICYVIFPLYQNNPQHQLRFFPVTNNPRFMRPRNEIEIFKIFSTLNRFI